jgi:hypothetical protein
MAALPDFGGDAREAFLSMPWLSPADLRCSFRTSNASARPCPTGGPFLAATSDPAVARWTRGAAAGARAGGSSVAAA